MDIYDKESTLKEENKVYDFSKGLAPLQGLEEAKGVSWGETDLSKRIMAYRTIMEIFVLHDPEDDITTETEWADVKLP